MLNFVQSNEAISTSKYETYHEYTLFEQNNSSVQFAMKEIMQISF